jgi:Zn-dependent protease with chaperone function
MNAELIAGHYFDGQVSRAHNVYLKFEDQTLTLINENSDVIFNCAFSQIKIEESFKGVSQQLRFASGAYVEVQDKRTLMAQLQERGYKESLVQNMQNSWSKVAYSVTAILGLFVALYLWGIPALANVLAPLVPQKIQAKLGAELEPILEKEFFKPSKLTDEEKNRIKDKFKQISSATGEAPQYQLEFRSFKQGPNAFALPGGKIMMSDELVKLAQSDEAVLGVLSHELGHHKHHHAMRGIIQSSAVGAIIAIWFGDVSSIALAIPATLAQMKYSRDFESEADLFAIKLMRTSGISTEPMAVLFEKMEKQYGESKSTPEWMSSHPITNDRIKQFRNQNRSN